MNGHALLQLARAWATVAHDGQSRKGAGEPYIEHPARVAGSGRLWGWRQQALAWLHDTIEDCPDPERMRKALLMLFPHDFVAQLMLLSRLEDGDGKKEPYQQWIERLAASGDHDVIAVKLADLEDNLADLHEVPGAQSLESRYLRAKATLLPVWSERS